MAVLTANLESPFAPVIAAAYVLIVAALSADYAPVVTPSQMGFVFSRAYIMCRLWRRAQVLCGSLLAAIRLTAAPEVLRFTDELRLILCGLTIVLLVLWRPNGLLTRRPIGPRARPFGPAISQNTEDLARPVTLPHRPGE